MDVLQNILKNKVVSFPFIFLLSLICLGLFNNNWYSLILYQLLFLLFYSSQVTNEKKKWLIVVLIVLATFIVKQNLKLPQISESSNVFIGGDNYKESIFKKKLPSKIFNKLDIDYQAVFPDSISGPDVNLYDKSVSQVIKNSNVTRYVETIQWTNRYQLQLGAFNDTRYNTYGKQQPSRQKLPYFIKYSFPKDYLDTNTKFCWRGLAYTGISLKKTEFKDFKCIKLNNISNNSSKNLDIWLIETGKTTPLQAKLLLPLKYKIKFYLKNLLSILAGLTILILLFKKTNLDKALFFLASFSLSFLFSIYFYPNLIDKFILFEGGNDGLNYVHFAHLISDSIAVGDFKSAFMGGERAYDLMPFYRYIWIINYLLFGESPWMLLFILTFFPIVIHNIFNYLLNEKWANYFLLFWFLIPIFEAFGFFHYYYVKLTLRGFGEPLSYLFFLSALSILIKFSKIKNTINFSNCFLLGILLSFCVGLRANILPACIIMMLFSVFVYVKKNKSYNIIFLLLGFSFTLIIPIHNYMFTGKFIPLTVAAYTDWNLGARPSDYIALIKSLFIFDINITIWKKIINHIHGEIKLYEVWYHMSIISCIYYSVIKNSPLLIRCIALSSLSLIGLLLFYHVGGRYSYLSWTLSLIVLSYWFKNNFLPYIKRINHKNAT